MYIHKSKNFGRLLIYVIFNVRWWISKYNLPERNNDFERNFVYIFLNFIRFKKVTANDFGDKRSNFKYKSCTRPKRVCSQFFEYFRYA